MRVDLADEGEWAIFVNGYESGYTHGYEAGIEAERAEVAALQRAAVEVVHALAEVSARDVVADRRRAQARASWWAQRRGEAV